MDFNYSDMQQMLLDSAGKLIADTYTLEDIRHQRTIANGLNEKNWAQFAELGWLALPIPEDAGGLGCGLEDVVVLSTALGRGLTVEPYVSTVVVGGHIVGALADEDARNALLGQVATGEARIALAHGEPGERFGDGGARSTQAVPSGNGFALTGRKMLVLDAPSATHIIVSATLDDGSMGLFLAPRDASGISDESYALVDGAAASDLFLDGVQVDAGALIASGSAAETLLSEASDRAAIALMAQAVGAMEGCNDVSAEYIKERKQFGQPIGKFQALQHIMADMFVSTHQARSMVYYALAHLDASPEDRQAAVSAAKVLVGTAAQLVSRSGIQLHGGYGVTDEYIVSHYYRRLLALEKLFGDIDHHVRRLAVHMFDRADA
ncbi:acyl-CoA dehydrogenase family protein [Sphingobium baderi]|uniref:acyl-CoA dehydrogenase family protein n=1 Tax=Sphingobium baderi TaxID=1332080 RepID=UPI002B40D550|nr:acyl-CoA dehydrogenase family protein [Sphingobium baderi]WRD75450.1 acyl-CoA dehydrogenase family protein [Sphingobium baderi]